MPLVALGETAREFRGGGGFAGALQTDHHDRDRRHGVEVDGLAVGAERGDQLVMDDLDHHLAWSDRLDDGGADCLFADAVDEAADHVQRDVGFQQRAAHFAHGGIDVGFRERAAPGQPIEYAAKFFRQIVEHAREPKNGLSWKGLCQNTFAPEGASRCRALTSGLKGRSAGRKEDFSRSAAVKPP